VTPDRSAAWTSLAKQEEVRSMAHRRKVNLVARFRWDLQVDVFRTRLPEFQRLHPELDLSVEIPDPEDAVTEKVFRGLAEGRKEADILDLHSNLEVPLAVKGNLREHFLDMTDRVAGVKNQYVSWEPCTWSGRIYGMPTMSAGSAYYFRPDIFEPLGIDPVRFQTWDDFIKAGVEV
jgi:ABC-type glycerol-3-phosphate transport system substrate-binding protein